MSEVLNGRRNIPSPPIDRPVSLQNIELTPNMTPPPILSPPLPLQLATSPDPELPITSQGAQQRHIPTTANQGNTDGTTITSNAAPLILEVLPNPPRQPLVRENNNQSETCILKLFDLNIMTQQFNLVTYTKPLIIIAFLIAAISFSWNADNLAPVPNYKAFIAPYYIEAIIELLVALLYKSQSSWVLPSFANSVFFPISCKLAAIVLVHVDADNGTSLSLWFCFLPILPSLYRYIVSHPVNLAPYQRMSNGSGLIGLILGIAEVMIMIKIHQSGNQKLASVFRYLTYCFIVTLVLVGISSLLAFCALLGRVCSMCRGQAANPPPQQVMIPWQIHLLTVFMGVDQLLCMLMASAFSSFFASYDAIRSFEGPINAGEALQLIETARDFRSNLLSIRSLAVGCLIYAVLRSAIGIFLMENAKEGLNRLRQELMARARLLQRAADNNPIVSAPEVEPGAGSKILNLLKVNSNYFVGIGGPNLDQQMAHHPENSPSPAAGLDEEGQKDELCSICVTNAPNCIILDCNHAGICKECSISMMKNKNLCPICRKVIVKICVVEKLNSTQYKVLEEIKI